MDSYSNAGVRLVALIATASPLVNLQAPDEQAWRLSDRGFEAEELAGQPTRGWYSDDLKLGRLQASADDTIYKEGRRSLRVELINPRRPEAGLSSVSQVARAPKDAASGNVERELEFSLKLRSQRAPRACVQFYVWDEKNRAEAFATRVVHLKEEVWTAVSVPLTVPDGHERFGIFVYLPGESGSCFWLDDASLVAR
jgi:hypothetical protein